MKINISSFQKRMIRNIIAGSMLALLLVLSSFYYFSFIQQYSINSQHDQTQNILYSINHDVRTSFGLYPVLTTALPSNGPDITFRQDLSDVQGIDLIKDNPEIKEALKTYGFAITPDVYDEFFELYKDNYDNVIPNFVTTDSMLHAFHVLYDYSLRFAEVDTFYQYISNFTSYMYNWARAQYGNSTSPQLHEAFKRITAYFAVPLIILRVNNTNLELPSEIKELTVMEISNINKKIQGTSPITGAHLDYSQFTIRGHYTRSEVLGRFFQALMYYGLMPFYLDPTSDMIDASITNGVMLTRMAALITIGVFSDPTNRTFTAWEHVYEPTTFYVGKADDLSFYEYKKLIDNIPIEDLEDNSTIEMIIEQAKNLPSPLILGTYTTSLNWNATSKSFRVMGQRFIPDSYFLQNLVDNQVRNRFMPSGLDVMNVLHSSRANYHEQNQVQLYPDFDTQIQKLRAEVSNWNDTTWTQNLYYLWLYSLLPLLNEKGPEYASFMRTDAWSDKELITALGSWAELRHDTVLYAKQSSTVLKGSMTIPNDGYVEPNPELYARLYSLSQLLLNGLVSRSLLSTDSPLYNKIVVFSDLMLQLKEISEKELRGEALNKNELNTIIRIHQPLESIVSIQSYNASDNCFSETDSKAAIIVDVHNDPNTKRVLEVGTGQIYKIYVITLDQHGKPILTVGGMYSYYEFQQDMNHRLTDEEWQTMLKDNQAPPQPIWILDLIIQSKQE